MDHLKEKFAGFMQGRYGADQLSKFTMGAALVTMILGLFIRRGIPGLILNYGCLALIIYTYFRMFSRNISKRYAENQKYLSKTEGIRRKFRREKNIMSQRKEYNIYSCPDCSQKIRIPKDKGRIEITCPKCGKKFIKKSGKFI